MEFGGVKRIRVLDVPVDNVDQETALATVERFLIEGRRHQLVFLDRRHLFKARRDPEFRRCLREASLILPVSGSIVRAGRFLKEGRLTRYRPFTFVIRLLALAERLNRSVYLLGARKAELEKAERNLKDSFPGLRLIGRFAGYFTREVEKNVLLAIKKSSPSFLLIGNGVQGKNLWVLRHKQEFNPGIYVWIGDCIELFSGRRPNRSPWLLSELLKKPWRFFLIIPLIYFWILVLIYRIFRL